jgi:hypothetical protein
MANLKLNKRQLDLVGESVLKKIKVNREALDMITNNAARNGLMQENDQLNEILQLLTKI